MDPTIRRHHSHHHRHHQTVVVAAAELVIALVEVRRVVAVEIVGIVAVKGS